MADPSLPMKGSFPHITKCIPDILVFFAALAPGTKIVPGIYVHSVFLIQPFQVTLATTEHELELLAPWKSFVWVHHIFDSRNDCSHQICVGVVTGSVR